jgi:hypothetical protein
MAHLGATCRTVHNGSVDHPPTCTNTKKVVGCQQWHFHPFRNFLNTSSEIELLLPLVPQYGFYRHVKKLHLRSGRKKDASLIIGCFRGVMALQPYWTSGSYPMYGSDIINSLYEISDNLKFSSKEWIAAVARNKVYKSNTNMETTVMANLMRASTKLGSRHVRTVCY